ncbi:ribosome biogenesis GTPase Der [candidate division LCP-89 bacterium B3_LCP]|uniref:GTPase Der n=1 Tax=candidate division LCP-89 bacterium B3_LCP TaxID=2012998 RepID=A0A532V3L0_UNCL8|nr:MAG: ribosome biogenesis GTPase Der [candidate division LCP-89 bacterium B3_LCP]
MKLPTLVIIGRPNVGKSSLFNRIIGRRRAIVDDQPGITRDRIYARSEWCGCGFALIDTGGLLLNSKDPITEAVKEQVEFAAEEAARILFILDWETGLTDLDLAISSYLQRLNKSVIPVVNKTDDQSRELDQKDFIKLGFGQPAFVSALQGRGIGDLLDLAVASLEKESVSEVEGLRIAIVGRPNVGKSSIVNALTGKSTVVVSDKPGTTRDATDTVIPFRGDNITLVDTAGLRRKGRTKQAVEFYSTIRTARAMERADIVWVVLDAEEGMVSADQRIISDAYSEGKGILLLMNKWDTVQKDHKTASEWEKRLRKILGQKGHLPIMFVSALKRQRLLKALESSQNIEQQRTKRIATSDLNDFFQAVIEKTPPPSVKGRFIQMKYVAQIKETPPLFAFFCSRPEDIDASYRRFLERHIRQHYGFAGVPIKLTFRKK